MADPIIPDEGKTQLMSAVMSLIKSGGSSAKVRLFTNDFTPAYDTVLADLTPATAGGLTEQATPDATDAGVVPDGIDVWTFLALVYSATGSGLPVTLYGYYVVWVNPLDATEHLIWAKRFDTPQVISSAGQGVAFVMSLTGNDA